VPGLVVLVPVAGADRVALDQQIANLALGHDLIVVVDELRFVPWHEETARTRPDRARPVRDEDMKNLGRPDPVQNLDPETLPESLEDGGRQRFASRDGMTDRREIEITATLVLVCEKHGVVGGNGEE